jgi:hypothetical protein
MQVINRTGLVVSCTALLTFGIHSSQAQAHHNAIHTAEQAIVKTLKNTNQEAPHREQSSVKLDLLMSLSLLAVGGLGAAMGTRWLARNTQGS